MNKLVYPAVGVLRNEDDTLTAGVLSADVDDKQIVTVTYSDGTKESFDTKDGNIESYKTGVVLFTTSDGDQYAISPVETSDGEWISSYKVALPVSNLKKLLVNSQESKPMPYLETEAEKMLAFQLPEDEYIFGILYINKYGAYIRSNGSWIEVSPSDSTFDGTTSFEVGRDKAQEFVDSFDEGALKVEDVQGYLIPLS
jgi:hypothetical protein